MKKELNISKFFEPLTGSDDHLLFDNPDMGYRIEYCLLIKDKYPDEIYLSNGVSFENKDEAEKHKNVLTIGQER